MKLIAMIRDADAHPDSHNANVHPDNVEAWEANGWARVESAPTDEADFLRAKITALGGTFHHKAGPDKLQATLDELLDAPHEDAGGKSICELNADLESLHIEIDPADGPAAKAAKIAAALDA